MPSGRRAALALAPALLMLAAPPAHATPPDETDVRKAVHFALQCHATVGTIDEVALAGLSATSGTQYALRGTYRQRVGGVGFFGFQSPEAMGGVFEGVYDGGARKLSRLNFKISVRTGSVKPTCLR